jgi:hypothetical protein
MLDHIDGSFSIFLHAPGFIPPNAENNNLLVDGYLPPREVTAHGASLKEPLDSIIQTFLQDIAHPLILNHRHYHEASKLLVEVTEVHKDHRTSSSASFFAVESGSSHFLFQGKSSLDADDSFVSFDQKMDWGSIVTTLNELDMGGIQGPGKPLCHHSWHF